MTQPAGPDVDELGIADYVAILRRRKVLIAFVTVAVLVVALVLYRQRDETYTARARVLLQASDALYNPGNATPTRSDPDRTLKTQIQVFSSREVRDAAAKTLGSKLPDVTVSAVNQTDVMEIKASDPSPKRAADVVNGYTNAYLEFRRVQDGGGLLTAQQRVRAQTDELRKQLDPLVAEVALAPVDQQAAIQA